MYLGICRDSTLVNTNDAINVKFVFVCKVTKQ